MAFTIRNWCRASTSANEPLQTLADTNVYGCFREYNYYTADTEVTVSADGYFNAVAFDITTGDYVDVYSATDGIRIRYRLTNTDGIITSSSNSTAVISVRATLSDANWRAMFATPIVLLPAPGANRMYTNVNVTFVDTYGGTQFTGGGATGIQYGVAANLAGTVVTTTTAGAAIDAVTANSVWTIIPAVVAPVAFATAINAPLSISNATAAFAAGNGSSFVIQVTARIVTTN